MTDTTSRALEARRLLRQFHAGVLSTHSANCPGYPYGAALPCCTDQQGRIVLLMSHLAEHTQNVERDSRASFTVSPLGPDLQQRPRATVVGDIAPTHDEAPAARYLRFFPEGEKYLAIGGFRFYLIEPIRVRLIAGFGNLHWIDGGNLLAEPHAIAEAEADILAHMNADHQHNLRDYCRHVHRADAEDLRMVGIDCDGFDVRTDSDIYRFDFETEVHDAQTARAALIALAQAARR